MIARAEIDSSDQTPDSEPAQPCLAALEKAATCAVAMSEAFDQLRQQFEQAAGRQGRPDLSPAVEPAGPAASAPSPSAAPESFPVESNLNSNALAAPDEASPPLGSEGISRPSGPASESTNSLRTMDGAAPAISDETLQMAAQLAEMAQRFLQDQSRAATLHESVAAAVDFMTQAAAQAASQSDLQQLAAQVETLRGAVHNLQSRAAISRAN